MGLIFLMWSTPLGSKSALFGAFSWYDAWKIHLWVSALKGVLPGDPKSRLWGHGDLRL
eukprot:UN20829